MAELIFRQRSRSAWEPTDYETNEIFKTFNMAVGDVVGGAFMRITEVFNGSTGDPTLELGDDGSTARFMATTDTACTSLGLKRGDALATTPGYLYTTANTVDINYVEDTTDNSTTTGICDVWIYVAQAYPF